MVPNRILAYLDAQDVPYFVRTHPRAVSSQYLAESLHVSGYDIAKTVLFEVDGQRWIGLIPGAARFNADSVRSALNARSVRLLDEREFQTAFPDCELGAEPPFGGLYMMPVLMDMSLRERDRIVVRAGTHEDALELWTADFEFLEHPRIASFAELPSRVETPSGLGTGV
jgi:Ala-tRNA(Pro) deacylase